MAAAGPKRMPRDLPKSAALVNVSGYLFSLSRFHRRYILRPPRAVDKDCAWF